MGFLVPLDQLADRGREIREMRGPLLLDRQGCMQLGGKLLIECRNRGLDGFLGRRRSSNGHDGTLVDWMAN
jgi:hypothetical protein